MNATERGIFEQFEFWANAPNPAPFSDSTAIHVFVGCGTSFYIAQALAAAANADGVQSIAVTGGEWWHRPHYYLAAGQTAHVIVLSRSGESTETVRAAEVSQKAGHHVTALTCAEDSSITRFADTVLYAPTHPIEGIVMTASASLMLLMGMRLAGITIGAAEIAAAEAALEAVDTAANSLLEGRSHFVFLGTGPLAGIAQEGGLKLQEMSLSYTQSYPTADYRHGPITLADERSVAVILYSPEGQADDAALAKDLISKGVRVLGFGGPGTVEIAVGGEAAARGLVCLPALQILGEREAQLKGLDSISPRGLSKVVVLG
ncbi:SIS domain-containing protein [Acidisoma cellulosilytica]|uniref:SIS domain-containing protein n=1 Tax=Acidisoma cellulosilyticum TaxID=2802395 RepID=A0A964E4P9_9PROT|nr:SIS domain-containing protein [Acidisoma cellulosilyticum]MCB8881537.1 SIS domain-containing protein [Acidisoma cellulosilyticum]